MLTLALLSLVPRTCLPFIVALQAPQWLSELPRPGKSHSAGVLMERVPRDLPSAAADAPVPASMVHACPQLLAHATAPWGSHK